MKIVVKDGYTFTRGMYMFVAGWFIGSGIRDLVEARWTWAIISLALATIMVVYRLYHPRMLLKNKSGQR